MNATSKMSWLGKVGRFYLDPFGAAWDDTSKLPGGKWLLSFGGAFGWYLWFDVLWSELKSYHGWAALPLLIVWIVSIPLYFVLGIVVCGMIVGPLISLFAHTKEP